MRKRCTAASLGEHDGRQFAMARTDGRFDEYDNKLDPQAVDARARLGETFQCFRVAGEGMLHTHLCGGVARWRKLRHFRDGVYQQGLWCHGHDGWVECDEVRVMGDPMDVQKPRRV